MSAPHAHVKANDGKCSSKTPGQIADQLQSKLSAVEKLQYQLTSHELQFAQRMAEQELDAAEKAHITVGSSSSEASPSDVNDGEHRNGEKPGWWRVSVVFRKTSVTTNSLSKDYPYLDDHAKQTTNSTIDLCHGAAALLKFDQTHK